MSEVNISALKEFIPELLALYENKISHTDAYSAAIDAAAHESKAGKRQLRRLVAGIARDKLEDEASDSAELLDLIEAVGKK